MSCESKRVKYSPSSDEVKQLLRFADSAQDKLKLCQLTGSDMDFNVFLVISLFVCCIIGGFVGKWIGKKRQYKWPLFSFF